MNKFVVSFSGTVATVSTMESVLLKRIEMIFEKKPAMGEMKELFSKN